MADEVKPNVEGALLYYVAICNEILAANENRFPYAHIWRALEDKLAGNFIEFFVVKDGTEVRVPAQFLKGRIRVIDAAFRGNRETVSKAVDWIYLQEVINNPLRYIANPALIDWDWITGTNVTQLFK